MDFDEEDLSELDELEQEEISNPLESSSVNPDFSEDELLDDTEPDQGDPALGHTDVQEEVKETKVVGKKSGIGKLLEKYPWILPLLIISFVILIAILIFQIKFDLHGVGEPKPQYYAPPSCGKVYLTWEKESYTKAHEKDSDYEPITDPSLVDLESDEGKERFDFKEYEYDTYISGIVWTDNFNAKDVDNEVVYEAMVIAARSRLIAELPDNCVVLKEYNEQAQSFTELDGSEEKYDEIIRAVANSRGIVIGQNGHIISAIYEPFSYISKRKDGEDSYNAQYFYHMAHENEEEQQVIPAEWVDELENIKKTKITHKVSEIKKLTSMSLYGAKYLLEMIESQFDLYRILENYYGRDIEYYTIDYAFSNEFEMGTSFGCSPISMNSTTLSKEEFIALAESYANRNGSARILADNAGMIYDMATSNGINPELVFIRADVEGYSPGGGTNNYWGIGCTNTGGSQACHSYRSLSEGVSAFLRTISGYTTLGDFYKYAYLGDYWYNPSKGTDNYWGMGGCPYASSIFTEIPERVRNACAQVNTCLPGNTANCTPTTEEDRKLYADFQARTMISARKRIFGLSEDTCEIESTIGEPGTGSCTIWKQGDSRWGSLKLGSSNSTIKGAGCAVTSVAIAMSCSGTQINNVATFNPGTLVTHMNNHNGFSNDLILWGNSSIRYFAPNFQYVNTYDVSGSASQKVSTVLNYVGNNTSVILKISNEEHSTHYVVFKSVSGTTFTVYDPAYGRVNTYSADDVVKLVLYRY